MDSILGNGGALGGPPPGNPGPGFPGSTSAPGTEPGCSEGRQVGGQGLISAGAPGMGGISPMGGIILTFSGLFTGPSKAGMP